MSNVDQHGPSNNPVFQYQPVCTKLLVVRLDLGGVPLILPGLSCWLLQGLMVCHVVGAFRLTAFGTTYRLLFSFHGQV